ncbi:MAG: ABC transporter substrate-binding protein [Deltaproteobacteria bacterium]|nr:ABC transporter substrate-binding protein [Deltaproteobacteria bacterium]
MKGKLTGIFAIAAMVLTMGMITPEARALEPYRIGAAFALTGPAAMIGEPSSRMAQILLEEVNAAGGVNGHPIEMITYDTKSDPTQAVLVIRKLVLKDKVLAIIGPTTTGSAMASIKFIQESKVPMVACVGGSPVVIPVKKWVFKTPQTGILAVQRLYEYFAKKGYRKVAILTAAGGFGDSGKKALLAQAGPMGIEIVAKERYNDKDTNMSSQLTSIRGTDAQAIVVWGIGPAPAIICKNARQLGIKTPVFLSHGEADPSFIKLAGDAGEGVMMPASRFIVAQELSDNDPRKAFLMKIKEKYEKRYGPVSTHTGYAYDALRIIEQALKKAGPDRAGIRDAIEKTDNYVGINGTFNMSPSDHNGLTKDSLVMVKVENGGWVIVP